MTDNDYKVIGENFARSAKENDMTVFACFEDRNLCEYGFSHDECLSPALAYKLTGKEYPIQDGLPEKATSVIVFKWLMSENIIPAVTSASTAMQIMMKKESEATARFITRILHF